MTDKLTTGDKVTWKTSQGPTRGTVEKKLTSERHVKGYVAKPTTDDPQYLVKTDKSGKEAVHKPDALKKA